MKVAIFQLSLFGINTYVVYDEATRKCAIIDPGMISANEEEAILNFIKSHNLTVTHIINTHLHIDHAIGNRWASHTFNVPVYAHKADEPLGLRLRQQAQAFGIDEKVSDTEISQYLEDGDDIVIGDGVLHVLHVPGHSPGSIVLFDKEDGFLIAGDVLFQGSVGRTDLPGGSTSQLISGIKEKLLPLPDSTIVYPGHGPATTIGREKHSNPFLL